MSQRGSGYQRKRNDAYETPAWVTGVLCQYLCPIDGCVWEPACGKGQMVRALRAGGFKVIGTDLATGTDFLRTSKLPEGTSAVITNPPFGMAEAFINHALNLTRPHKGLVAMLTRIDYDSASTRRYLFAERAFCMKIVLTKRIIWFAKKGAAPSFNHQWLLWNWQHKGPPTVAYGP